MNEEPTTRDYDDDEVPDVLAETGFKATYARSWAVVIGINHYPDRPLKYAVHDAAAVARILIERFDFAPGDVFLVLEDLPGAKDDEWILRMEPHFRQLERRATSGLIEKLLETTLPKEVGVDDRVLVYFAGHGAARAIPGRPRDEAMPYLVASDTVHDEWDTYVDLTDVLQAERYLAAKHVFYMLDACCSGLAGQRADSAPPSRFERALLQRKARQCLTAGTAEEQASDQGYDGHSIFTYHLLQALQGVGLPADSVISASSIIERVKNAVANEPNYRQTPNGFPVVGDKGGQFVFATPRTFVTLEDRARLARLLVDEVDRRLDEPSLLGLSDKLWQTIVEDPDGARLAPEARRRRAQTLLMRGESDAAQELLADPHLATDPEAMLLRGIGWLRGGEGTAADARAELAAFAERHPTHPSAGWARLAAGANPRAVRRRALLVGVQKASTGKALLNGCENDVAALAVLLERRFGFEVTRLLDEHATREGILRELERLSTGAQPADSFVLYFSGRGYRAGDRVGYGTYDVEPDTGAGALTEDDIDHALRAMTAADKLLITDACFLAPRPGRAYPFYRFLSAGTRDQNTYEHWQGEVIRGVFSAALERVLAKLGNVSMPVLLARISADIVSQGYGRQAPQYAGPHSPLWSESAPERLAMDLVERRDPRRFDGGDLERLAAWVSDYADVSMQPVRLALGRALLANHRNRAAVEVLTGVESFDAGLPLARALLGVGRAAEALDAWTSHGGVADHDTTDAARLRTDLEGLRATPATRALLVGTTTRDTMESTPSLLGRARDALRVGYGFAPDEIEVLVNAGNAKVVAAFGRAARSGPTFFLFMGPIAKPGGVFLKTENIPGREGADLELDSLAWAGAQGAQLTAAIFATGSVYEVSDPPIQGYQLRPDFAGDWSTVLLDEGRFESARDAGPARTWIAPDVSRALAALERGPGRLLTAGEWRRLAGAPDGMSVGGAGDAPMFASWQLPSAAALTERLDQQPLWEAIALLTRLTSQRRLAADAWLHLGVLHAAVGHPFEGLENVEHAIAMRRDEGVDDDHRGQLAWAEAQYHRGRILASLERYAGAVEVLKSAQWQRPHDPRVLYHLARTIRRLIELDLSRHARQAAEQYLDLGSPLGVDEELGLVLGSAYGG